MMAKIRFGRRFRKRFEKRLERKAAKRVGRRVEKSAGKTSWKKTCGGAWEKKEGTILWYVFLRTSKVV